MAKQFTHVRVYPDFKEKVKRAADEMTAIERKKVSIPEALKRMGNIPKVKEVLLEDSRNKAKKYGYRY